jgi:hypothetical protein
VVGAGGPSSLLASPRRPFAPKGMSCFSPLKRTFDHEIQELARQGTYCQAPGYSGPVRAVMPSNRSILAYLTAVVARQRFVSSLTRQYTSTSTIAVHLVSIKTLLLDTYHVDKVDFLTIYTQIRPTVLTQQNIQTGFQATGLIPPCPDTVQP